MFKKILLIISLLTLVGCAKINNDVITIIKENDNCVISINYPITESKKLNKNIKKEINKIYKNFKKNYCSNNLDRTELNIDFKHETINNKYINVILESNYYNQTNIKTYVYNLNNNKIMNIYDILTENDLDILVEKIKLELKNKKINDDIITNIIDNLQEIQFNFNDKKIYIFLNLNKVITLEIPIELLDLKIEIKKENKAKEKYTYKEINKIIDPNKKTIALTFDDGPSKYTKQIVELLNKYNANATFFILGNKVETYNETLKYLLNNGNEIGNHSYNHKWLTHVTTEELLNQINTTQNIIKEKLNYTPTLFRPTYGSVNKNIKENINLDIILWNVDTLDWKYKNSKKISENVLKKIKDGDIILMHDTYEYTYNALKLMLPKLKEQGYQLVTVSELKETKKIKNEIK